MVPWGCSPWSCGPWGCKELHMTERLNNNIPKHMLLLSACGFDHIIFDHMYNLTLLLYFYSIYLICTTFFFLLLCHAACRILVPQPRIQTLTPAAEAQSFNHWTTKEVLSHVFFICKYKHLNYQLSVVIEIRDTKILK